MGWVYRTVRRLAGVAFLAMLGTPALYAQHADTSQRLLFAPAPLGVSAAPIDAKASDAKAPDTKAGDAKAAPRQRASAIPTPKARPRTAAHKGGGISAQARRLDGFGDAFNGGAGVTLATPQPQAVDLTPRVDLGGLSLGLATNRDGGSGSGGTGLVTLDTKTPIPIDPTLATRQNVIPYFGLSLSAPTN